MIVLNLILALLAVAALAAVAGVGLFGADGPEEQELVAIKELSREPDRELEAA
jgi:hypothetical protein